MPARRIVVGLAALTLCTGGASLRPTSVIHGVSVYVRDGKIVDAYCRAHVRADNLAPVLYGCYVPADNLIMIAEGDDKDAILAHELRHVDGWEHHGWCRSRRFYSDVTVGGRACDWYRR